MKNMMNPEAKWDKKALTYPRYTSSEDTYEAKIIRTLEGADVSFKGKRVLDVGCGSGKFTLRIAKEAASVLGTDISSQMLRILHEDAEKEGADNLRSLKCTFDDFDPKGEKFDIVFASVTPAVRTEEHFRRVTELAGERVVYIGWAGRKESEMLYAIYERCGITPKIFNDVPVLKEWLAKQNIPYKTIPVEETWVRTYDRAKAEALCMEAIEDNASGACIKTVAPLLDTMAGADGRITDRMHVKMEMIIW
ncbi:class I SAM-dependent methyltransferase [Seleniivibrio sp.]|uniref:class I SAM-dependent methyltransferase n=1 Tax=Seleniivibrio sp. TaxID=2898801 RepID=UPI0025E9FCB0|nr:class I SAM-dependent methyltransferase [Seleniivibrio sp.]MCD8552613.1 class I SAM-dependent methyltransferase [Seleniivibrio sp.]